MKKKSIYLSLLLITNILFAQDFKAEIEKHREDYKTEFLKSSNSPLNKDEIEFLMFFDANEKLKIVCKFTTSGRGKTFKFTTSAGKIDDYIKYGELHFSIDSTKYKLTVYQSVSLMNNPQYRDYLFIPFKDLSNGKETYGGGRYLDLRIKELKAEPFFLDFNKAYNPYCAFKYGYSCPIPPRENHLKVAINAGEKNFAKEQH